MASLTLCRVSGSTFRTIGWLHFITKNIVPVSKMTNYYFLIPLISTSYPDWASTIMDSGNSSCMGGTSERLMEKDSFLSQIKLQKKVLEISYVEHSSLCSLLPWCHISKEDDMELIPKFLYFIKARVKDVFIFKVLKSSWISQSPICLQR